MRTVEQVLAYVGFFATTYVVLAALSLTLWGGHLRFGTHEWHPQGLVNTLRPRG